MQGAYLGLLWKNGNQVLLSAADEADLANDTVFFAPRRWLTQVSVATRQLLDQQLSVFWLAQWDARPTDAFSSNYIGVHTAGPITSFLTQETAVVASIANGELG